MAETVNQFCIRADYVERPVPAYAQDAGGVGFQPHVYALAGTLGRMLGAKRIIDVGCGVGSKLAALYPRFDITGLDYGENLSAAKTAYPFGTWLDVDLERIEPQAVVPNDAVIVCADVIEHLVNPSRLVDALCLWMRDAAVGLVSTPERVLCWGADHKGPPPNPAHVREWSRVEFERFLTRAGLCVAFSGFTQTHIEHPETGAHQGCQTILVILEGVPRS